MGFALRLLLSIENALLTLAERNHESFDEDYGNKAGAVPCRTTAGNEPSAPIGTCSWLLSGGAVGGLYAFIRSGHPAF
jgi:hypothetical protein